MRRYFTWASVDYSSKKLLARVSVAAFFPVDMLRESIVLIPLHLSFSHYIVIQVF